MSTPYSPDLRKVSVLIKTFLRDQHLAYAVAGLHSTMPEAQIIVVDDGDQAAPKSAMYDRLIRQGHRVAQMPFDSGFGAKSNVGASLCDRPYLLIGSDDFDFHPPSVRQGVERLVTVLDNEERIAIASGRVNNNRYEGLLDDQGSRIVERYINFNNPMWAAGVTYHVCNLTVNYSLIRRSILGPDRVHWDDDVKIGGGEHGAFFVDVMRAGHKVAWVPNVNIGESSFPSDVRYQSFRGRASRPGRECFARRGIREYVLFGGEVERA